jgi:hypothetical protein
MNSIISIQKYKISRYYVSPSSDEEGGFAEGKDGRREK